MSTDWDDEYDAMMAADPPAPAQANNSFIDRVRRAAADGHNDDDLDRILGHSAEGRDYQLQRGQPSHKLPGDADTPLRRLIRHWMNERHAPDILPTQEELLSSLLDHIRRQSDAVQLLRGDPGSSEEEHIRIMLAQTEVERVKFVVRSYIRTRLFKIEKYARYITTNVDVQSRISEAERQHASRHANLTDRHFHLSVLQSLPPVQASLDDAPVFLPPMSTTPNPVTAPDRTRPVFVHALVTCPPIRVPDGTTLTMEKGHISLLPFHIIEQLLIREEVELV